MQKHIGGTVRFCCFHKESILPSTARTTPKTISSFFCLAGLTTRILQSEPGRVLWSTARSCHITALSSLNPDACAHLRTTRMVMFAHLLTFHQPKMNPLLSKLATQAPSSPAHRRGHSKPLSPRAARWCPEESDRNSLDIFLVKAQIIDALWESSREGKPTGKTTQGSKSKHSISLQMHQRHHVEGSSILITTIRSFQTADGQLNTRKPTASGLVEKPNHLGKARILPARVGTCFVQLIMLAGAKTNLLTHGECTPRP